MVRHAELVARIDAVSALKPMHRPVKFEKEMAAVRRRLRARVRVRAARVRLRVRARVRQVAAARKQLLTRILVLTPALTLTLTLTLTNPNPNPNPNPNQARKQLLELDKLEVQPLPTLWLLTMATLNSAVAIPLTSHPLGALEEGDPAAL